MKQRILVVLATIAWIAAACSSTPAANTVAPVVTNAAVTQAVTSKPAATSPAAPAISPSQPAAAAATTQPSAPKAGSAVTNAPPTPAAADPGGAVTYHIVPGESTASYQVGETFLDQNRFNTAIGVTPQVTGDITLDMSNPQAAQVGTITVDVSQLKSDSGRRDNFIRGQFLSSSKFPNATFVATQVDGLPASYTEGQEITFKVTGNLTVAQTTKPATFDVTAKVQGGELTGTATTTVKMSDFGIGPITLAILKTEDDVKVTLNFVARPS